jgi:hypothetical protein
MSVYRSGSVNVVHGSSTITGVGTEWLKYVSNGSMFKIGDGTEIYSISRVISNTSAILSVPYKGLTANYLSYSITFGTTPNLNLPLIDRYDPDAATTLNQALSLIDKQAGNFLSFQELNDIEYSGEDTFFIRGDYHSDELMIDRAVEFKDIAGDIVTYNFVENNTLWNSVVKTTPTTQTVSYRDSDLGEYDIEKWDIVDNVDKQNHVFVESINPSSDEFTYSGEVLDGADAWEGNDTLRNYGKTKGLALITDGITESLVPVEAVSGEVLDLSEFKNGDILYNFDKGNYRSILVGEINPLQTAESDDDWEKGDYVYTIESKVQVKMLNLIPSIKRVYYGSRAQLGVKSVKMEHIDFGFGNNQVDASDIPISIPNVSGEYIDTAIQEVQDNLNAHKLLGIDVHTGTAITFVDDSSPEFPPLESDNTTDAINELKVRIGWSGYVTGIVDESDDTDRFIDHTFIGYPEDYFAANPSGEWFVRFEDGVNEGQLRAIYTFDKVVGEFFVRPYEPFPYLPNPGDQFSLLLKHTGLPGSRRFIELDDCPNSYSGHSGEIPVVKGSEDGMDFLDPTTLPIKNHLLSSPIFHTGISGTEDNFMALDDNGLPKDSGHKHSDYEVAGAVSTHQSTYDHTKLHDRKHDLTSSSDHGGITGTENNFIALNASGLPKDSGSKAGDFATSGHNHNHNSLNSIDGGGTYHLSSTDYTDLTDAGDSSLHYHSSDRNRSNHSGTQARSTISDFAHKATHESGGGDDAIKLDDLSAPDDNTDLNASTSKHGLLIKAVAPASGVLNVVGIANGETAFSNKGILDSTNPTDLGTSAPGTSLVVARRDHVHTLPKLDDLAAPDDNTDLNVSTTKHGLCPKAPNVLTQFLRGDGTWADVPFKHKFISGAEYNANFGNFRVRSIAGTGAFRFTFNVPLDFVSLVSIEAIGIPAFTGDAKNIDLASDYGAIGETYNTHSESDTISTYSGFVTNKVYALNLASVFTALAAGDYCGVLIDHVTIGGSINYLGILLKYA